VFGGVDVERIYRGLVASPGLTYSAIAVLKRKVVLEGAIESEKVRDVNAEVDRLERAKKRLMEELEKLKESAPEEEKDLLDAEVMMLEALVAEATELILSEGIRAEVAVKNVFERYAKQLKEASSSTIALRVHDLEDLATRLIGILMGVYEKEVKLLRGKVVVADKILPLDFMNLIRCGISGIVSREGGLTSHVAILARSYGIPYLIVSDLDVSTLSDGYTCILDCINGVLIINPRESTLERYRDVIAMYRELSRVCREEALKEAVTRDGIRVHVLCNVGSIEEAKVLKSYGGEGIGILRLEFVYMGRSSPPTAEDIEKVLEEIVNSVDGEVTVRALDIGADKPVKFLQLTPESNPQLGLRGIRLLLQYRDELLKPFIEATLRLAARVGDKLRIMLPLVSSPIEVKEFMKIVEEVENELREKGVRYSRPKLGIMVETPAAAILLDRFVKAGPIEFISLGTNDLTQYVLAVDRENPRVAHLYSELHPAVLRLIRDVVERARRCGLDVEICGEMTSNVYAIPILISIGIRKLSVSPSFVGRTKYVIRKLNVSKIKPIIDELIDEASTPEEVREVVTRLLRDFGVKLLV